MQIPGQLDTNVGSSVECRRVSQMGLGVEDTVYVLLESHKSHLLVNNDTECDQCCTRAKFASRHVAVTL